MGEHATCKLSRIGLCTNSKETLQSLYAGSVHEFINVAYYDDPDKFDDSILGLYACGCRRIFIDSSCLSIANLVNWKTEFFDQSVEITFFDANFITDFFVKKVLISNIWRLYDDKLNFRIIGGKADIYTLLASLESY